MNEMKTWVTPKVEVQNFQANEYVSVCVTGSFFGAWFVDRNYYVWNDADNDGNIDANEVGGRVNPDVVWDGNLEDSVYGGAISGNSDHNSGTLTNVVQQNGQTYSKTEYQMFYSVNGHRYFGEFTPTTNDGNGGKAWS